MQTPRTAAPLEIQIWPIDRLVLYARNPRKNDAVLDRMCSSIREFGFKIPVLARSDGEVVDGHLRLKAARKLGINEIPVILCEEWTPAQVKAFRLLVNRSVTWASWVEELLALELQELTEADFDLDLTGFNPGEIDGLLAISDEERANATPPVPEHPVSVPGDLWLCGSHRVLCGDATSPEAVARLLGDREPLLMVTDPPYGIELDSEWRDRAGLNGGDFGSKRTRASKARAAADPQYHAEPSYLKHRTEGHTETTISGDTRADWSEVFELVPSLQIAYVWHASRFTREVLNGLLRIGFEPHQQLIWDKGRTVLTRTLYWFQHEPCWFVRKKNAPWYGKAGENSTIWAAPSPKFVMGGSDEDKFDHPTQKPVELMRRPILNHTKRGELVYEPFLGSGTTLAAAELTERVCLGLELDPKYVDVIVGRWEQLSGKQVRLEGWSSSSQPRLTSASQTCCSRSGDTATSINSGRRARQTSKNYIKHMRPFSRRRFLHVAAAATTSRALPQMANPWGSPVLDFHFHYRRNHESMVAHMEGSGVARAVLLDAPDDDRYRSFHYSQAEKIEPADRFFKFASADMTSTDAVGILRQAIRSGAIGFGELISRVAVDGPEMRKVYELAAELKVPLLLHFQEPAAAGGVTFNTGFGRLAGLLKEYHGTVFVGHASHRRRAEHRTGAGLRGLRSALALRCLPANRSVLLRRSPSGRFSSACVSVSKAAAALNTSATLYRALRDGPWRFISVTLPGVFRGG